MFKLKEVHKYNPGDWHFSISLHTRDRDEVKQNSNLFHVSLFRNSWWFIVPEIIQPKLKWVDISHYGWADKPGYWEQISKEYGFHLSGEALHIRYGIQPGCFISNDPENSDHSKCYFLPWKEQRRIRYDFLNLNGTFFKSAKDKKDTRIDFDAIESARNSVEKIVFKFKDFDGEEIEATCHIEEMEYVKGTSWCSWLRYFIPNKVYIIIVVKYISI